MSDGLRETRGVQTGEMRLSTAALKALAEIPGMVCGSLSPLARLSSPGEPPQRDALIATLESTNGAWQWAVPALLDPHTTVSAIFGDGETTLLGQYVWPDVDARGPGFKVHLDGLDVRLEGPVAIHELEQRALDFLSLAGVDEIESISFSLTPDQFWALVAVVDAYREAALRRRLSRAGGLPLGVSAASVSSAWEAGLAAPNPGWSVSLYSMLLPGAAPTNFTVRLPGLLRAMEADGLLTRLEAGPGDSAGDLYFFDNGLDDLCQALNSASVSFGLTVQRKRSPSIELARIGGWRTSAGLALVDLGGVGRGEVRLVIAGPEVLVESMDAVLGIQGEAVPFRQFAMSTNYSREAILTGLGVTPVAPAVDETASRAEEKIAAAAVAQQPTPTAASSAGSAATSTTCPKCGSAVRPGVKFCTACGASVPASPAPTSKVASAAPTCPTCGAATRPGVKFCTGCGAAVKG